MAGRRSYQRFNINPSSEGLLRLLCDVTVQRAGDDEFEVIGREPGVIGETMTIAVADANSSVDAPVIVIESVPLVIDGAVRHRIVLRRVSGPADRPGPARDRVRDLAGVPEEAR